MSALRFHPHMRLVDAAKLAYSRGMELRVIWEDDRMIVEPVRLRSDDYIPIFLRPQCDPSGGADFCETTEKVVKLCSFGA